MDSERWRRVEDTYYRVLDTPIEQWSIVLDEACGSDSDLRHEVESLLQAHRDAGDFLAPEALHPHLKEAASAGPLPTSIGPYRVEGRLGAGAMGEVYRARDTRLNRPVALKILPAPFVNDAGRLSRFRTEAKAASALNHPNIVTIYEIGEAAGTWFIAQELIEGATLRESIATGPTPIREAIAIGRQCAAALDAAHRAGILHRDIKPENIMLRADGVVKLVDFGLARMSETGPEWSAHATETGVVLGTPRYMSPEQARGVKLDARTDVFSLAAILFEMVHGKPAFPGFTPAEVFNSLLSFTPEFGVHTIDLVLRRALEKDPAARYASMSEFAAALSAVHPDRKASLLQRARANRRLPWLVAATLAVVLIAYLAALRMPGRAPAGDAPIDIVTLTTFTGLKDDVALSPSGDRFAFAWNGGTEGRLRRSIYVQSVRGGSPLQLTHAPIEDLHPAWSPDGASILFLRRAPTGYSALAVPAAGGPEQLLAENGDNCASWSPDGKRLVLAHNPHANGGGLYLLNLSDHTQQTLTGAEMGTRDYSAAWSPDGRWIAFYRSTRGESEVHIISSRGGPVRRLTFDGKPKGGGLTWTRDSREIVYATERESGGAGIWRIAIDGGEPRWLSNALQFAGNPSVSTGANRLAYTNSWTDSNLYLYSRSPSGYFETGRRVVASSREDHSPSFSPDGKRIAFVSNRTGFSELWLAEPDGSQQTQLTDMKSFVGTPRWSPDGKFIAFDFLQGNFEVYTIPSTGGPARRLTDNPAQDSKPSWSPDGRTIYFTSNRAGTYQLWAMNPDGSSPRQVTSSGAREGAVSADGKTIYFTHGPSASGIWQMPATGGTEEPVPALSTYNRVARAWGVLPTGIYFISVEPAGSVQVIRYYEFATGKVSPVHTWESKALWTGPAVAMSRDGQHLLIVQTDHQVADLMMIENFR